MDLKHEFSIKRTGVRARQIAKWIIEDENRVAELMELFFDDNLRVCQHASWYVGMIAEYDINSLDSYMQQMIDNLNEAKHNAIVRNTIRAWQFMTIPDGFSGEVYDICSAFISNPREAIGPRVFSMAVCFNIAKDYPELLEELRAQLIDCMKEEGKAITSRSQAISKSIDRILS